MDEDIRDGGVDGVKTGADRISGNRALLFCFFFFSSRRRHTRLRRDWSSDVCSSDLVFLID